MWWVAGGTTRGHSRRGIAAPPSAGRGRDGGRGSPPHPPPAPPPHRGKPGTPPPPPSAARTFPPLLVLRCEDIEPHPGPMRVALRNVTSLRLHWHAAADWRADVVLIWETHLTAVAQRVMRAQARASGGQAFWGAPLESRGGGSWDAPAGGWASWCAKASQPGTFFPLRGHPAPRWTPSPKPSGTPPVGRGADSLHAQVAYGVSAQPALNRTFWDQATQYVARHGAAP